MDRYFPNPTLKAGFYMVCAMASFVSNDTLVKQVGSSLPVGETVAIRGAFTLAFLGAICIHRGVIADIPLVFSPPVLFRATLDLAGTLLFITALTHMPIANLTAITQAVPLAVALLSYVFLKERVGWRRITAILAGFAGVLLIVRPAPQSITIYEIFALAIVVSLAVRDIITRRIPARVPTLIVALANAIFVPIGGVGLGLVEGWVIPEPWQVINLAAASVLLGMGYMFMVATLRTGELSATAPFRYSIVIFAIISGVVMFGEYPDALACTGMALIVGSGLYAAHREARLKRRT